MKHPGYQKEWNSLYQFLSTLYPKFGDRFSDIVNGSRINNEYGSNKFYQTNPNSFPRL